MNDGYFRIELENREDKKTKKRTREGEIVRERGRERGRT
jgi:hypothetical protein